MRVTWKFLFKIYELYALLSKVNLLEGKKLMWALKPAMLALIQRKFLDEPFEGVRIPIVSCLSNGTRLTAPIATYDDDVMKIIFRLIVETFQDLDNSAGSTFGKKLDIFGGVTMNRTYEILFDLECDDLIIQMFQCFFSIRKHHPDKIITHMQYFFSSCMRVLDAICWELQSRLLSVWRREKLVSPITYGLAERLVEQKIGLFRRHLTREE